MPRSIDVFTLDPGKISARQLLLIIITVIISTADIFLPAIVADIAGKDAWISVFVATAQALVVAAVAVALALRFPNKTIIQICEIVFGKWLGWVLAFTFFFAFLIFITIISVGQISVILKVAFMNKTPLVAFVIIMIIIVAYAVNQGIEVIARVTELLMPLGIGMLVLVGLLISPQVDLNHFLPIMADGISPVLKGATRLLSFLGEAVIILMLVPYLNKPQKLGWAMNWSMILLGGSLLIGVMAIGMFGVENTSAMTYPALEMIRRIQIGDFLEHLDAIIVTIWVSGIYIKVVVFYYICCTGLAQLIGCKNYRPLIIPMGVFLAAATVTWTYDINSMIRYITNTWPAQALFFEFVLPLMLLAIAAARGLKEKEE